MNSEEQNKAVQRWQSSAPYWDKYRVLITQMFAPVTGGLIEEARIGSGHKVLDIGGGSGEPSLTIAGVVGPTGSVMFTDPAPGMFESAQAEAGRRGLTNIQFRQCSADDLPFADNAFDVAVGRFSAMFFVDPLRGIREALRVVRSDGCVSFAVWGPKEVNPFFSTLNDVFDRLVESPPEDPDSPDPFRFAVRGELAAILKEAGADAVTERQLDFQIEAPVRAGPADSFDQFWQLRTEMSESLREKLKGLTPEKIETVKQAVREEAGRFFVEGKLSFPTRVLIVTGGKQLKTED